MNNLAEVLYTLGDLDGAEHLHKLTVTGRERVLGGNHPDTLTSRNNLAATVRSWKRDCSNSSTFVSP
jgi:Tetratricopeptide repeat